MVNITIDSEKITGDISLNGKVSITNDFDITGKKTDFTGDMGVSMAKPISLEMSVSMATPVTGDASFNKNVSISGGDVNIYDQDGNTSFSVNTTDNTTTTTFFTPKFC